MYLSIYLLLSSAWDLTKYLFSQMRNLSQDKQALLDKKAKKLYEENTIKSEDIDLKLA